MDYSCWWEYLDEEYLRDYNESTDNKGHYDNAINPRYNIKIQVYDETSTAWFKLLSSDVADLIKISCYDLILSLENPLPTVYPVQLMDLIGREVLFLVDRSCSGPKVPCQPNALHEGYIVSEVCDDKPIIAMFHMKTYLTPEYEVMAKKTQERSEIENTVLLIKQPTPISVLIERIRNQRKDGTAQSTAETSTQSDQDSNQYVQE